MDNVFSNVLRIRLLLGAGLLTVLYVAVGVLFIDLTAAKPAGWTQRALYVSPNNDALRYAAHHPQADGAALIAREGHQPVARWFGNWDRNVKADAQAYVTKAAAANAVPVLVSYNIPNRDCGGLSAGGAQTEAAYASWIKQLADGIGSKPAVVILEPDAVSLQTCLNTSQKAARYRELGNAVTTLGAHGAHVYIDAGHPDWISATTTAARLQLAGINIAAGFALNTSNFTTTPKNLTYGNQISHLVANKHYVVDTSRNGNGPTADMQWCNPSGRALGVMPTAKTASPLADAYLWVKTPWASDGSCNGNPSAGQDNWPYAIALARAAGWQE